jgi:hypothetical protein
MSSSVTAGNGSEPPSSGVTTVPVLVFLDGFALSSWLVRVLALFRCVFSFQPSEPNEPLRISAIEGAFDAVLPVAAHMPGGGLASINFRLAVRILFEAVEAFVDVLCRRVLEGESGGVGAFELVSRKPAGCGKGTGVEIEFGGAILAGERPSWSECRLLCVWWRPVPSLRVWPSSNDRWYQLAVELAVLQCLGSNLAVWERNKLSGWQRHYSSQGAGLGQQKTRPHV